MKAVNWNKPNDFDKLLWDQNIRQFWVDTEIPLSDDKITWMQLSAAEKNVYKHVLGGLTLLDTQQGSVGMPRISMAVNNFHQKAVLSFMGTMEHMHAKSYSSIFSTLCTSQEIDEIFNWVDTSPLLREKLNIILNRYNNITDNDSLYIAMACSVLLESFLFYSGFFYPLYLSGSGKLANSGEIINLIIRDESIHGVYVGQLMKQLVVTPKVEAQVREIFNELFKLEEEYTKSLYAPLGLEKKVINFVKYNANKAFANMGLDIPFDDIKEADIDPSVIKGLDTKTKTHDFFSTKGNGYVKSTKVEKISEDDFNF
jgi:ribonucleoside-diphosphate reductase beta chain